VITGAFFFVRSLLQFVNGEAPFAGDTNGWLLTAFFFFDAWLLGECLTALTDCRPPIAFQLQPTAAEINYLPIVNNLFQLQSPCPGAAAAWCT
jgi:hypothetical protein